MTYSINVLPDIPLANTITTADTIGTVAAVGATAAVIVHGAATLTRNKILDMKEEKTLKKKKAYGMKRNIIMEEVTNETRSSRSDFPY